jgi:hypothetical protein
MLAASQLVSGGALGDAPFATLALSCRSLPKALVGTPGLRATAGVAGAGAQAATA